MPGSQVPSTPQVRTLLLTDLVDSTGLVERIGDNAAAALFRAHDRIVLDLQQRWRGRLIDRSDGLLLIFERPIDGLGFALDYVRGLRELGREHKQPLQARAGLHVGEVLLWENSVDAVQLGAKSLEVEGLAKPLAGRLMALARSGQILLSATAEPLAHRAARELGERGELLVWKSYGRWRFKGVPEAQEIHEVGEPGLAPLRMPSHTPKAWRDLPLWRRPVALAAETMILAAMLVGGWFITRPQPAIAFGERDWVVVGDLRNLTGDPRLDDSLEQAFRISLEQSRYVNVLSDLKVRETLQRMQRPGDAKVDRASGSEIAMRDGARALLLPTVAEVGGRLRVSAEVVDPRTQTTVYAVSADGKGIESALGSIDEVTDQLREQLGEAMQNVQKTSVPLPNVATPSLDALKAFAIARNVSYTTRDREQVLGLYRRALQLDPQFALAHADMAHLLAGFGEVGAAADEWRKALGIPGRLSPQEKQRIDLMLLQNTTPAAYFRKVDEYLAIYPDDSQVISRSGTNLWHQRNDLRGAEARYRQAMKPAYPNQGSIQYSRGVMLLGQERHAEALAAFRKSREMGFSGWSEFHARAYDMRGQHAEADRVYLQSSAGRAGWQGKAGVVTWIDRGEWERAGETARAWHKQAVDAGDRLEALRARAAIASLGVLAGTPRAGADLRGLLADSRLWAREIDAVYPPASGELQLYAGLLAAYLGDRALVADALAGVEANTAVRDYPTVAQLREVVLAEQERLSGKVQAAVARLVPLARQENALVAVHWALMNSQRAAGDAEAASAQSRWLAAHHGRAFVEATTTEVLPFFNAAVAARARKDTGTGAQAVPAPVPAAPAR
ncbi:MAG TPA: putative peptide modification system cyclase [Thermomonas sp.]|nr:putative peptide modification system cyclase [Thermomonas sp.]